VSLHKHCQAKGVVACQVEYDFSEGSCSSVVLSEGGCSLTSQIMTLAKGVVALLVPHA